MKISEHISSASTMQKCAYQNCKKCEKFPARCMGNMYGNGNGKYVWSSMGNMYGILIKMP